MAAPASAGLSCGLALRASDRLTTHLSRRVMVRAGGRSRPGSTRHSGRTIRIEHSGSKAWIDERQRDSFAGTGTPANNSRPPWPMAVIGRRRGPSPATPPRPEGWLRGLRPLVLRTGAARQRLFDKDNSFRYRSSDCPCRTIRTFLLFVGGSNPAFRYEKAPSGDEAIS
jgi:hypothetical protein